jgi:hypothetical protein
VTAELRLEELAAEFDPSYLHGHYVCGRRVPAVPEGWRVARFEGWTLAHHEALPALDLVDVHGARLGWLLGNPVDPRAAEIVTSMIRAPVAADDDDFERPFGDWLYQHGGRFAAVVVRPEPIVYPDAYALLPVLFRADTGCIASSPFLLPDREGRLATASLAAKLDLEDGRNQLFPLATTPLEGVDHLVANHVLDLETWQQRRHWPTHAPEAITVEEAAERVAVAIEPIPLAAVRAGNPRMGLTAGGDTRTVLACMREIADAFEFVTLVLGDDPAKTDAIWAPRIASRFGLSHRILPRQPSTPRDARLFFYRTGAMNGESRGRFGGPTWAALGGPAPFVTGGGGEVLRAVEIREVRGWQRFERVGNDALKASDVLRFAQAPLELRHRAEEWLAGLPPMAAVDALELLRIEMRNACWYGTLTLAFPEREPLLHTLTHRAVTEAALGVPFRDRLGDRLRPAVIASRWPELLEIPFNRDPLPVVLRRRWFRTRGYARAAMRRVRRRAVFHMLAA